MPSNSFFPHQRLLITLLILASLLFTSSLVSYYIAIHKNETKKAPLPTISPTISPIFTPSPSKQIILTPQDKNFGSIDQDSKITSTGSIRVGRDSSSIIRGFIYFDITGLPMDKKIKSVILRVYQSQITGNPYKIGGNLRLDGNNNYLGTLSTNDKIEWKELDVTGQIQKDINKNADNTEFVIYLRDEAKSVTNTGDYIEINDIPQLVITFE